MSPAPNDRSGRLVLSGAAMMTLAGSGRRLAAPTAGRFRKEAVVAADLATRAEATPSGPGRLADRPSEMATETIGALLGEGVLDGCPPSRRGLVIGSGAAGMDQTMTVTTDSLTRDPPYLVGSALVPACVMNYASALCAIRYDIRGPNVTVTAGRVTGLAALAYGRRLLRCGRADLVVCGAYEDWNERRTAIERLLAGDRAGGERPVPGEGCCVFLLETAGHARLRGRPALAELVALEAGTATGTVDRHTVLAGVLDRALRRAGVDGADVAVAVTSADDERTCRSALPDATWVRPAEVVGDTYGAEAAFQLAAALLADRDGPDRLAVVAATDPDGQVGCAMLRLAAPYGDE